MNRKIRIKRYLSLILIWLMIFNIIDFNNFGFISKNHINVEAANISTEYDYTGKLQTFTAPYEADYKFQVWGAQGGGYTSDVGGKGGYSEGIKHLKTGETVNIYVGGQGTKETGQTITKDFNYTGDVQSFTAPESGYYFFESWGASGGGNNIGSESARGLGGFSSGTKYLNAGETVYVYVGGQGSLSTGLGTGGGYNGGGHGGRSGFGGGGMTHFSTTQNPAISTTISKEPNIGSETFNEGLSSFTAPLTGNYTLEVWGGQGANDEGSNINSNKGGYSKGTVKLTKGQTIYICVGGAGRGCGWTVATSANEAYNGGGRAGSQTGNGGGGATSITTTNRGVLANFNSYRKEVLIVAGGGGGAGDNSYGGSGGGTNGGSGAGASGGTQTSGYAFGKGENAIGDQTQGGGGGWFGGYRASTVSKKMLGAGGGSGYIGGVSNGTMQNNVKSGSGLATIKWNIIETIADGSWDSTGTFLVAGGGGGADNIGYPNSILNGRDDGSGGHGGGTNGGNAKLNGIEKPDTGATQTTGFKQGVGESVTWPSDAGGAGAGWFGGIVTNNGNGGAGGGSGYIDGVIQGTTIEGKKDSNGYAKITYLKGNKDSGGYNGGGYGGVNAYGGGGATDISVPTRTSLGKNVAYHKGSGIPTYSGDSMIVHNGISVYPSIKPAKAGHIYKVEFIGSNFNRAISWDTFSYCENGEKGQNVNGRILSSKITPTGAQVFVKADVDMTSFETRFFNGTDGDIILDKVVFTDITTDNIIVAAGGGGSADNVHTNAPFNKGADGGGLNGNDALIESQNNITKIPAKGGSQSSGGKGAINKSSMYTSNGGDGDLGIGGFGDFVSPRGTSAHSGGGGGAGYYGGGGSSGYCQGGGAGGSSYIGGVIDGKTDTREQTGTGNGKAIITLLNSAPVISMINADSSNIENDNIALSISATLTDNDNDNDKLSFYYSLDNNNWNDLGSDLSVGVNKFTININHSEFIEDKIIYFKTNDGIVDSDIFSFTYNPISSTLTKNLVNLDSKYNGAIYYGDTSQQIKNYGNVQSNPTITIDTNRDTLKSVKYFLNGTLLTTDSNINIPNNLTKIIHNILPQNLTNTNAIFKIELIDNNNYVETINTNIDMNGNILTLRKNTKPKIVNFVLPTNEFTGKNIYDKLMTNQPDNKKHIFEWNINSGSNDNLFGDTIQNVRLQYSTNGTNWNYVSSNELKNQTTFSWLNTTGIDNTNVKFKLLITDSFGDISEEILDNSYYLQVNNKPNAPLNLIINNLTSKKLFKNNDYKFEWGIATETDINDEIETYIFGFTKGTVSDGKDDYNNYTILYEGLNQNYNLTKDDWTKYSDLSNSDSQDLTFGVWAIDKFGTKSLIKTYNISTINNQPPNKIKKSDISIKDKTFESINKGFIKRNETYQLLWNDKGDPNTGDNIARWNIKYSFDIESNKSNNNQIWNDLNTTTINYIDFNIDSKNIITDKIFFKIIAYDSYGSSTESEIFDYNYITDITPPKWTNPINYNENESDENGQKLIFEIEDISGVSKVEIKDASMIAINTKTYPDLKNVTFESLLNKNGIYTLVMTDKYLNVSSQNVKINTIDNFAPTIKIESLNENKTNKDVNLQYTIIDDTRISEYVIYIKDFVSGNILDVKEFKNVNIDSVENTLAINQNCIVTMEAIDKSNNRTTQSIEVKNIYKEKPVIINNFDNDIYQDMQGKFNMTLSSDTLNNLKTYKKITGDNSLESTKIISKGNYKYVVVGNSEEITNITEENIETCNLEHWKIKSNTSNYSIDYNNTTKEVQFLVNKNNVTFNISFYDAWGNFSTEDIYVNNIIDGIIDVETKYLVAYQDFKDTNPAIGDITGIYLNSEIFTEELRNKGYINPDIFVEIGKDDTKKYQIVYGYIEIKPEFRKIAQTNNYSNNQSIEILKNPDIENKPFSAMCKFSSNNKSVSFYIKDVLSHYVIKRLSIDDIQQEKSAIITAYPENINITNKDTNVLFTVTDGWFKDNELFYQYQENEVIHNYYDDFVWYIPKDKNKDYPLKPTYENLISNTDSYYKLYEGNFNDLNDEDKIAFTFKFKDNKPFKAWAVNKSGDWIFNYFVLTNIDKENPEIIIDGYNNNNTYSDKLIINAYTIDEFYTKEELINIYKNSSDKNFLDSLENYEISDDKKVVKLTFDKPLYNTSEFKLYAKDKANNIGKSENIDLTKIYISNIEYIYSYKYKNDETYTDILYEDLLKLKTNKDIDIKIKINNDNQIFQTAKPLYPNSSDDTIEILSGVENIIKYTLTKDNSINATIKDKYNNIIEKTFNFNGIINKEKPILTVAKENNLDIDNKYIKSINLNMSSNKKIKIVISDNKTGTILYESLDFINKDIYTTSLNSELIISYEDEYGNKDYQTIKIENILTEDTLVIINSKVSTQNYTNKDITVTFSILNGYIKTFTPENENLQIIEQTENKIVYHVKENIEEIKIEAINYIKENNSTISKVSIYNIDKIAPNQPMVDNIITNKGYNSFLIVDGGDEGIGTNKFNYKYQLNSFDEKTGDLKLSNNNLLIVDAQNFYEHGDMSFEIKSIDGAGNISTPNNSTIKSNDSEIFEINTNFDKMMKDLVSNELTEEKIIFYNQVADDIYNEVNNGYTYINDLQKEYALQKVNDFKTYLGNLEITDEDLLNKIKEYFDRLEKDIYDNSFMDELQLLINKIPDKVLKDSYQKTYDYYYNLINNIFIDNTNNEFNYTDSKGNILNPLSGYITESGICGYYDIDGNFVKGKHNQLYYYNSEGILVQLSETTYLDGINNTVNINSGIVNNKDYYNEEGTLIDYKKYIKGFYDFEGKWHNRGSESPLLNPEFTKPEQPDTPDNPDEPDNDKIYPTSITLPYNELELFIGDTITIKAILTPKETTANSLIWNVDNTNVVKIDNGKITALNEGTTLLTVITENNLKAEMNVIVNKKGSNSEDEEIIQGTPKPTHPSIDDLLDEFEEEQKEKIEVPNYSNEEVGNIQFAFTSNDSLSLGEYKGLYSEGYSTVIIDTNDNFDPRSSIGSGMDVGIGTDDLMIIMSNKDITRDMDLDTFKVSVSGKTIKLSFKSDYNIERLGINSYVLLLSKDEDLIVTYNGNPIVSTYDKILKGYIVKNPLSGSYKLENKKENYDINSNNGITLSYANVIKIAYNMLNGDDYGTLYSNINENSEVYREASILQKYGIIGKDTNISNMEAISVQKAYDIIYLTLSNIETKELNYDISFFKDLVYISETDINNMILQITNTY